MDLISGFWLTILTTAGINAIIATGLYFSNAAGALSVAHAAIAGMAGYSSGVVTVRLEMPFGVGLLAGVAVGVLVGIVLAWLTSEMHELVAGLTTLAFGQVMVVLAFNINYLGGANGFSGFQPNATPALVLICLILVLYLAWRFERSRLGYAAQAARHSPIAASAMGVPVKDVRIRVWAIGGGVAALGGVLNAHYILFITPGDLAFWMSLNFVIFWVFGGSYSFIGPAFGAVALTVIPEFFRFSVQGRFILYGVVLVILILVRPSGVIPRVRLRGRAMESTGRVLVEGQ